MPKKTTSGGLVLFWLDDQIFGLPLEQVVRVERAVKITFVPDAPPDLLGVINNHGRILPVIDLRQKTGLTQRPIQASDQMIIVRCHYHSLVIPVDKVEGVFRSNDIISSQALLGRSSNIPKMMNTDKGIAMVISADRIISFSETLILGEVVDAFQMTSISNQDEPITD